MNGTLSGSKDHTPEPMWVDERGTYWHRVAVDSFGDGMHLTRCELLPCDAPPLTSPAIEREEETLP